MSAELVQTITRVKNRLPVIEIKPALPESVADDSKLRQTSLPTI